MVEEERELRAQRLLVTDQRIIEAYSAIAFGDARRVLEWDDNGEGQIEPSEELTPDEALLVQGVERVEKPTLAGIGLSRSRCGSSLANPRSMPWPTSRACCAIRSIST
jgi:hypothetical protein